MANRSRIADRTTDSSRVVLLVVEYGGMALHVAEVLTQCGKGALDTIVMAQQSDESPSDLASRVVRRLLKLEREGRALVSSTLFTSGHAGLEWQTARAGIVDAVQDVLGKNTPVIRIGPAGLDLRKHRAEVRPDALQSQAA